MHVGNLQITYAGMTELGWQGPLPRKEGAGETEGSSLDFEQEFFLISSCLYYKEHQDFERNGYENIMVGQIPPLQAIFAADLQATII